MKTPFPSVEVTARRAFWLCVLCAAAVCFTLPSFATPGGNPTISSISNQTILKNSATSALAFTVAQPPYSAATISVTASSSNKTLVPDPNIVLTGYGVSGNRTVTVTPAVGQIGVTTITLSASRVVGMLRVAQYGAIGGLTSFTVTVNAPATPPTITPIAAQWVNWGPNATASLPFTVSDAVTAAGALVVTASSSNHFMVPNAAVAVTGPDVNGLCSVVVTPFAYTLDSTTITLTVTDDAALTASTSFILQTNAGPGLNEFNCGVIVLPMGQMGYTVQIMGADPTALNAMIVTATSDNQTLVPDANIALTGPDAFGNGTVEVTAAAGQSGLATITVTVTDGMGMTSSRNFTVAVYAAPTISTITDQVISVGTVSTDPLAFTVGDSVDDPATLQVTGVSSNEALLPSANITFGGFDPDHGAARTVLLTPSAGASGVTTITLTVAHGVIRDQLLPRRLAYLVNGRDLTTTMSFVLTVLATPPTISPIADQVIRDYANTGALPFTVSDKLTAPNNLVVTATSDNLALIPLASIDVTGPDANGNCTVRVSTLNAQCGSSIVTLTVTNGNGVTATTSFRMTAMSASISKIDDQVILPGNTSASAVFSVQNDFTTPDALVITAVSSDTTLTPDGSIILTGPTVNGDCSLAVTPIAGAGGFCDIKIIATYNGVQVAKQTFELVVITAPVITRTFGNQVIAEGGDTGQLPFTISDFLYDNGLPLPDVAVWSSNQMLVPDASIVLNGPDQLEECTLEVAPVGGQCGTATITLSVTDNYDQVTTFSSFIISVYGAPTITSIPNKSMSLGTVATSALAFTVGDAVTPADALSIAGDSSNVTLVPSANIVFGGSGAARTVKITPAAGLCGVATITLTVTNGGGQTATTSFTLTIYGSPTITPIANQLHPMGSLPTALDFTVGDSVTPIASLTVTGASNNQALVPDGNITCAGTDAARTVTIMPCAGVVGVATITLTVMNNYGKITRESFTVKVYPPPTISTIPNKTMGVGTVCTSALGFTVGDTVTPAAALTVTGVSSNPTLAPSTNVVLGGSGSARTVTITPLAGVSGVTTIMLSVCDGGQPTTMSFTLAVTGPPTITALANQFIPEGATPSPLSLTVRDPVTPAGSLTVTATSSNPALVPTENVTFGGSNASRSVTITPLPGVIGSTTIKLTVTNGAGRATSTSFTFRVYPPPTITTISNKTISLGTTATSALGFTVGDTVTPLASLSLAGASSNTTLVPTANIVFGGTGAARTVQLTPSPGVCGVTTITLTVTDTFGGTSTMCFTLTVNGRPTITPIAAQTIAPSMSTSALNFTVGDDMTPVDQLIVSGTSNNQALAPNANIIISGTGAARTVTVTPTSGLSGALTISLKVTDGGGIANVMSFALTVKAGVKPPR